MNKEDTIERLCRLVCKVGDYHKNQFEGDCFCQRGIHVTVSNVILQFIEDAVKEKMARESK